MSISVAKGEDCKIVHRSNDYTDVSFVSFHGGIKTGDVRNGKIDQHGECVTKSAYAEANATLVVPVPALLNLRDLHWGEASDEGIIIPPRPTRMLQLI